MVTQKKKSGQKDPVLVVVQLSGGNDFLNTVIPFTNGIYYDVRNYVGTKKANLFHSLMNLHFIPMQNHLEKFINKEKWQ